MSDDLISRQAAIELWDTYHPYIAVKASEYDKKLRSLPSAERHGRWKPFDLTWGRSVYACTSCGEALEVPTECGKPMYEFCPNCGAKMDEVGE